MSERAKRYAAIQKSKAKQSDTLLIAHVKRTPKGKIRLARVDIRISGSKDQVVTELPPDDPRYVFESDYKIRKMTHDIVKRSGKFSTFFDCSARVFHDTD